MKKLFSSAALAAAILASPFFAQAADKEAPADAPKTQNQARLPFNGKISAVDKNAKTITLEGKEKARVFLITSETRIRKERKPATLDEVQVGERVGGSYRESAEGKMELLTLNVGIPTRAARAKEGDKPKEPAKQ
jgi:hypothetical protein